VRSSHLAYDDQRTGEQDRHTEQKHRQHDAGQQIVVCATGNLGDEHVADENQARGTHPHQRVVQVLVRSQQLWHLRIDLSQPLSIQGRVARPAQHVQPLAVLPAQMRGDRAVADDEATSKGSQVSRPRSMGCMLMNSDFETIGPRWAHPRD